MEDGKSDLQLAVEVVGQFGAGYLTLTEMMRLTMPSSDGYQAPIGSSLHCFVENSHKQAMELLCTSLWTASRTCAPRSRT